MDFLLYSVEIFAFPETIIIFHLKSISLYLS